MDLLRELDYVSYLKNNPIHELLGIDLSHYGDINRKIERPAYETVSNKAYPNSTELDDLIRLHYLTTSRKVTTVLELGVGKSTAVFSHALSKNKENY